MRSLSKLLRSRAHRVFIRAVAPPFLIRSIVLIPIHSDFFDRSGYHFEQLLARRAFRGENLLNPEDHDLLVAVLDLDLLYLLPVKRVPDEGFVA